MTEDIIAAISTPVGAAGISIIRICGTGALDVAEKIFRSSKGRLIGDARNYSLMHGQIVGQTGRVLDEVLISVMREPHSFTSEDTVEINCHGGMLVTREILQLVLRSGARLAEAGEFSKRAFLNGRIDLAQAESIIDLINAKTQTAADLAVRQLEGTFSQEIIGIKDLLLEVLAHIEAGIDFPENDIEEISTKKIEAMVKNALLKINRLIHSADVGKVFREGLKTVIAGKPNVGKSSLLNALLRENRAIVTDIPGTTRDVIEEIVNIRGIPIRLIDTAGIRETADVVEKMGVEKTKLHFPTADLILLVLDASTGLTEEDSAILSLAKGKKTIIIVNKMDLDNSIDLTQVEKNADKGRVIPMSVLMGQGLEALESGIEDLVLSGLETGVDEMLITNVRHQGALQKAAVNLEEVLATLGAGLPTDFMAIDLKFAWDHLGEITGETVSEDLVDQIFSRFCIGK